MSPTFEGLTTLLTTPPGSLLYHLVLALSILMALQIATFWLTEDPTRDIARLGLGILLAGQLVLFIVGGLVWQGLLDGKSVLPALERLVMAFNLFWLARIWLFPANHSLVNRVSLLVSFILLLVFLLETSFVGLSPSTTGYNASFNDIIWFAIGLVISLTALSMALLRRQSASPLGYGVFVLLLSGILGHFLLDSPQQDFSPIMRLAQLCAFPLIPGLLYKTHPTQSQEASPTTQPTKAIPPATSRAILTWSEIPTQLGQGKVARLIAQAVAQTTLADMCLVLSKPAEETAIVIEAGYDLVHDEPIPQQIVQDKRFPQLTHALTHQKSLLIEDETSLGEEGEAWAEVLGLQHCGSILAVPFQWPHHLPGLLVLLSPYTGYHWSGDDLAFLQSLVNQITKILAADWRYEQIETELRTIKDRQQRLQEDIEQLREQNRNLQQRLEESKHLSSTILPIEDLEKLLTFQQKAQDSIAALEAENRALKEALAELQHKNTAENQVEHLEGELRATLEEVARLQNALAEANIQILALQQRLKQPGGLPVEQQEVLSSLIQEMRQTLSSILGYVDLLMGETVGILSALQRKFLERIRVAADKTRNLIDRALEEIGSITAASPFSPGTATSLDATLDQVFADLGPQLQQRDISLNLDLPETSTYHLSIDSDSLYQALVHILQNILSNTPISGSVTLRALSNGDETSLPYLILQISNHPREAIQSALRHPYEFSMNSAFSLKDAGKGYINLALIKALIESFGGRVYLDYGPENTVTVSLLLPLQSDKAPLASS